MIYRDNIEMIYLYLDNVHGQYKAQDIRLTDVRLISNA